MKTKKISLDQARVGMYVSDVFSYEGTLLLSHERPIADERMLEQMRRQGVRSLTIDVEKGLDVAEPAPEEEAASAAPITVPKGIAASIEEAVKMREATPKAKRRHEFEEEVESAQKVHQKAVTIVSNLFSELRMGRIVKEDMVGGVTTEIVDSVLRNDEALLSLVRIKNYDEYTFTHCVNVSILAISLGRALNLEKKAIAALGRGGLLHDVGKMKIPPEILNKPGRFTPDEFMVMRQHPEHGLAILEEMHGVQESDFIIVGQHHERDDGLGYPFGLRGEQIHLYGMLSAIADVYDAMTTERPYKDAYTPQAALAHIFKAQADKFPKPIINLFTRTLGIYPIGSVVKLTSGELAVVSRVNRGAILKPEVILVRDSQGVPYNPVIPLPLQNDREDREILSSLNPRMVGIDPARYLPR